MGKRPPIKTELLKRVAAAIQACWEAGNPVAGGSPESWNQLASVALRRMLSFSRRGVANSDRETQVRDVALGLVHAMESRPRLLGPLFEDYLHVAAAALDASENSHRSRI